MSTEIPEAAETRAAELAETHNLSKARREGAELALADAMERGEWPAKAAPVVVNVAPVEVSIDPAATADRVVEVLRRAHIPVSGATHKAIRAAV